MSEGELEKVMLGFMHHKFDVLVCTTIIENGLDIPMANTIVMRTPSATVFPSYINCAGAWAAPIAAPMRICLCPRIRN